MKKISPRFLLIVAAIMTSLLSACGTGQHPPNSHGWGETPVAEKDKLVRTADSSVLESYVKGYAFDRSARTNHVLYFSENGQYMEFFSRINSEGNYYPGEWFLLKLGTWHIDADHEFPKVCFDSKHYSASPENQKAWWQTSAQYDDRGCFELWFEPNDVAGRATWAYAYGGRYTHFQAGVLKRRSGKGFSEKNEFNRLWQWADGIING